MNQGSAGELGAFALMRGGPFDRFRHSAGLVRDERADALRQSFVAFLVASVPLLAIGAVRWFVSGKVDPLLLDFAALARPLLGIPLFLIAEQSLNVRTRRAIERLGSGGFLREASLPAARQAVAAANRLREERAPEVFILALTALNSLPLGWLLSAAGLEFDSLRMKAPTPVGLWYGCVSLPLFQFLMVRWLWRWGLWAWLLWSLSRLKPQLAAAHPDHMGGLDFVQDPSVGLCWALAGLSCVLAASGATRFNLSATRLQEFAPLYLVFAGLEVLVAAGPALLFSPLMWRARFVARRQYGQLALAHARLFHQRWIVKGGTEELLGSADMSSLQDLGTQFESLQRMQLVPLNARFVRSVLAATVLPVIPLVLMEIPLPELVRELGGIFLGGNFG